MSDYFYGEYNCNDMFFFNSAQYFLGITYDMTYAIILAQCQIFIQITIKLRILPMLKVVFV